jgi:hypothetical protein
VLNTSRVTAAEAQRWAHALGGELVAWDSGAEQVEVERAFINSVRF